MRINEEYKKSGYFWLPGERDKKVPGTLTIKDGGDIELEVVGLFDDSKEALQGDHNIGRIVGTIEGGRYITLEDCFYKTMQLPIAEVTKSIVYSNMVLSGAMWEHNENITFNTYSFSFDLLDEWLCTSSIDVSYSEDFKSAAITYTQLNTINYELDNGMNLEISFRNTLPGIGAHFTEAKITQEAFFKLRSEDPRPLEDYKNIVYKIHNLISFAIDDIVSLKWVQATSDDLRMSETRPVDIDIYYSSRPYKEQVPNKMWHEMMFTFPTIKNNAQDIFNNWINAYETLSPAIGLYFSTQTDAYDFLEGEFLAFAQGIETFHRRTSNESWMDPSEYQSIVAAIMEDCPEGFEGWLESRLKYGNEISLRQRIKKIIEPFKKHLGNQKNRKIFIGKVVDTRNYLTHYDEDSKEQAATGRELWELNQKIEAIFKLHFLTIIGFNESEIDNVINTCRPFKQIISKFQ